MEDAHIETLDADEQNVSPKKKPTFLKVLCVLSFISGGLMLVFSILALLLEGTVVGMLEQLADQTRTIEEEMTFQHIIDNYKFTFLLSLFGSLVSLLGVFLMFNLSKIGFHIYTVAQIAMIALPPIMTETPKEIDSGIFGIVLGSIGAVAFVVMYSLNLKHMK
ncbi:MAG: hypothetical protein ACI9J3_004156 [Parvicellaceae bacterium]|jgi:hypothetical protein